MRLCACLGVGLDIIEPCGFPWDERKIRRSGMDYIEHVDLVRHGSWERFVDAYLPPLEGEGLKEGGKRLVLLTTKTDVPYTRFIFTDNDILIAGRESAGVPDDVHNAVTARVTIPMAGATRSLNVVNATAMIVGEALRQLAT